MEQSYNSLAAQRDACAAYVASQKHEGWILVDKVYDDGGFSGGSLQRPALQELFEDLKQDQIDIVVVYKVDRLTRSLADFSKLTELFDQHHVSFVAVTQQFNTSTSMGRLTLNVLLSFAQFEREVAGERIRDKIRASKKRGMWMGGHPPLGYDVVERKLVINEEEAKIVRIIFESYLTLGSVRLLGLELRRIGVVSKNRRREDGISYGGRPMLRGALDYLLRNQIYLGKIIHKGELFDGQHRPIVSQELFDAVQTKLASQGPGESAKKKRTHPSLLQGLIFDENGVRLQPTHANKNGRRYRYYVSASIIKDAKADANGLRIPAPDIEQLVLDRLSCKLSDQSWIVDLLPSADALEISKALRRSEALAEEVRDQARKTTNLLSHIIVRVAVSKSSLRIDLNCAEIVNRTGVDVDRLQVNEKATITVESHLLRSGKQIKLIVGGVPGSRAKPDPRLVNEITQARRWFGDISKGKSSTIADLARASDINASHVSRRITLAFLAPDIVEMILAGTQPVSLTPERLKQACPLPATWQEQRALLLN